MDNKCAAIALGLLIFLLICSPGEAIQYTVLPEQHYVNLITQADLMIYGNLSHIKYIFKDPINQSGGVFTIADLTVLDVIRQSNITPVKIGDTLPIFVNGGTIGNESHWKSNEVILMEGEGPNPAGIYCLFYSMDERYPKGKYHITTEVYNSYTEVKQDIADLSSGKLTDTEMVDREKKNKKAGRRICN